MFLFMAQTKNFAPRETYCLATQQLKDCSNQYVDL